MKKSVRDILHNTRESVVITLSLMLLCGFAFPLFLTGVSSILFPEQAKGNLITVGDKVVGTKYVGQEFTKEYYMWSRPSAYHYNVYTEENGVKRYNDGTEFSGISSGSNNYAPSNPKLKERVEKDIEKFLKSNPTVKKEEIPTDLLTASGSGLDPHISPKSAKIQIPRIAKASGLSEETIYEIVKRHTNQKTFGIFGEDTVNVLEVNIEIGQKMGILQD